MVRVTIKFPTNACDTEMGVRDKQIQASETNGERTSDNFRMGLQQNGYTGMDHTTAVNSCRECWHIPDTCVQDKLNKSVHKGVKLC